MTDVTVDILLKIGFTSSLMALTYILIDMIMPNCKEYLQHIAIFTFIVVELNLCFMQDPRFIEQAVNQLPLSPVITYGALFIVIVLSFLMHVRVFLLVTILAKTAYDKGILEYYGVDSSDKVSRYRGLKYFCYREFCDLHGIMAIAYMGMMFTWIIFSALGIVGVIGFLINHISL